MIQKEIMHLLRRVQNASQAPLRVTTPKQGKTCDDLMNGMNRQMSKVASFENLDNISKAVSLLQEASEILEEHRKVAQAEKVISLIEKIASKQESDYATKGLTSEKEIKNLKDHGTPFNLKSSYLDMEVDDLKVDDEWGEQKEFED